MSGVDLFFVISGFIMVWVAGEPSRSEGRYRLPLRARTRIYPLWWIFAAVGCAKYFLAFGILTNPDSNWRDPAFFVDSFLLLPQDGFPVLSVGWTLVHEVHFYLVFAALLFHPAASMALAVAASLAGRGHRRIGRRVVVGIRVGFQDARAPSDERRVHPRRLRGTRDPERMEPDSGHRLARRWKRSLRDARDVQYIHELGPAGLGSGRGVRGAPRADPVRTGGAGNQESNSLSARIVAARRLVVCALPRPSPRAVDGRKVLVSGFRWGRGGSTTPSSTSSAWSSSSVRRASCIS